MQFKQTSDPGDCNIAKATHQAINPSCNSILAGASPFSDRRFLAPMAVQALLFREHRIGRSCSCSVATWGTC